MIYLDNAATTYKKPPSVKKTVSDWLECGNAGRGSHSASLAAAEMIYKARGVAAELFGAEIENVVFTNNATTALNFAVSGVADKRKSFLISDFEHNSVRRPVIDLCENGNCNYSVFTTENESICLREVRNAIKNGTDCVVCLHKSNVTGRELPIAKIGEVCRNKGVLFIVDASQSAGNSHIDMKRNNIDILCLAGHKGLYGPQGTGLLILSDGVEIKPTMHGGSGADSRNPAMPDYMPDRLEAGTLSAPLIAGLMEGMRFVSQVGYRAIAEKEAYLFNKCRDMLDHRNIIIYDMELPGANLLFNIKGKSSAEVSHQLDRVGICTRPGLHCSPMAHDTLKTGENGAVRISFSYFTTENEIAAFCKEIRRMV